MILAGECLPELPEVETTLQGVRPWIKNRKIQSIVVRNPNLRWPVALPDFLVGSKVLEVWRRGKYLVIDVGIGSLIAHLGMSGSLRIVNPGELVRTHDHLDIEFSRGIVLRYNDPRRFGSWHYSEDDPLDHWLLRKLGLEPLSEEFCADFLHRKSRSKAQSVKAFIMDGNVVVGVGNIYASEALFLAGIRPTVKASRLSLASYENIVKAIKRLLTDSIRIGGTTLRDFVSPSGQPGYFQQTLNVYGREGKPCKICSATLKKVLITQRSSVYCPKCQGDRSKRDL